MMMPKTYGWHLASFRLPKDTYTFDVLEVKDGPDEDTVEMLLKVAAGDYHGHRLLAYMPREDRFYEKHFRGLLEADHGIIVPATVTKY
jgi:hypothetical protein